MNVALFRIFFAFEPLPITDLVEVGIPPKHPALRSLSDGLKQAEGMPVVALLTGGDAGSVPFVFLCRQPDAGAKAGELAKAFGAQVGGGGGGRPDFAQGQGSKGGDLEGAVAALQASWAAPA